MARAAGTGSALRADAVRNAEQIRRAAIDAFRGRGLGVPLEEVAAAAGVSKATIYNRFGGRNGLVDAVIEELVAGAIAETAARTRRIEDPWDRIVHFVTATRDLQYREPAAIDVLLQMYPDSPRLMEICHTSTVLSRELVEDGHRAGILRQDFTEDDFYQLTLTNGLALKHGPRPDRADYDRRTGFLLDGMKPVPG